MTPIAELIDRYNARRAKEDRCLSGGRSRPVWLKDGRTCLYWLAGRDPAILRIEVATGRLNSVLSGRRLARALDSPLVSGTARLELLDLSDDGQVVYVELPSGVGAIEVATGRVELDADRSRERDLRRPKVISSQFPTTFGNLVEVASPDGARIVTLIGDNLVWRSTLDGRSVRLTHDGTSRISWRSCEESCQQFPVCWAPDSVRFAAVRLNTTEVAYEPLSRWMGPQPEIDHVAYPRAGGRLYDFEVAIFNTDNNKFNFINIGDCRDCYVNLIDWSSDGRYLYLQILDREHHHLRFLRANASDGSVHSVLEAHTQTYFDTPMTLGPVLFKLLTQGQGFLRLSERDGFRHIYHHADDGSLVRQLTTGTLPVDHIVAVDEIRGGVYYLAPADPVRPYDLNLFVVSLDGAQPQRLTPGAGHHSVELSPDLSGFLDRVSAVEFPPIVCARSIDGDYCVQVDAVDSNELGDLGFGGMETFSVPSRDGRFNLFGVIARPFGFDPARRYPVVEFIYGGMQYVHAPREFYSYGLQNGLPELRGFLETGFVVVMVDTPGTPGRGREFQDATYGVWPRGVIAEHVSWIQAAGQTRPWMDLGRVGIYGHSWGAYMAQRAVIDAPEFYRVAAGHAGPSDFCDHPTYIEPFLGLPSNNPDSYAFGSNLSRAAEIKAPVLVIGAPLDVNAGFSPSLKFVDAMVRARRDVDFFMLPETNHAFASGGDGPTAYMAAYVSRYLMSHLGVPVSEVKSLT